MASIYAKAYSTIVAIDGNDDTYGLRGLREGFYLAYTLNFGPNCKMMKETLSLSLKYFACGWTLQGYIISSRKLEFHHPTVTWLCRKSYCKENLANPKLQDERLRETGLNPFSSGLTWNGILNRYKL
ncbi:hypothetical protein K469DRAFT_782854 [Zopfia rhizophila CBS 207.26]|uniref:Heterokaryon incompatibility domain-containing protein n=1 Tax=Zopfia rhizophila CBS 207.26 TaxID=1314779 RepID=A0A6A6EPQ6_9PEZI|nr:hypothetical protein K469DRAFT_782854 [Zopfia rhizophila CBS 207.26]